MAIIGRLFGWISQFETVRSFFGFSLRRIFGDEYDELLDDANVAASLSNRIVPATIGSDDKVAIHWYSRDEETSGLSYRDLHQLLRASNHERGFDLIVIASFLNEAIHKLDARDGLSFRIMRDIPGLPLFVPGTTICEKSFLSSSRNPRVPFPGSLYFVVFGKTGRDIGPISAFQIEDEILFPPRLTFLITSKEALSDGSTLITMEELT